MVVIRKSITIISTHRPSENSPNEELRWFAQSLGLFGIRDRDKSCFRLFIELLKATKRGEVLSSDDLAERSKLSRGTVVHHLNRLMELSIVVQERKRYMLRDQNLARLLDVLHQDMESAFSNLRIAAVELDKWLTEP